MALLWQMRYWLSAAAHGAAVNIIASGNRPGGCLWGCSNTTFPQGCRGHGHRFGNSQTPHPWVFPMNADFTVAPVHWECSLGDTHLDSLSRSALGAFSQFWRMDIQGVGSMPSLSRSFMFLPGEGSLCVAARNPVHNVLWVMWKNESEMHCLRVCSLFQVQAAVGGTAHGSCRMNVPSSIFFFFCKAILKIT